MSISQLARSIKESATLKLNETAAILRDKGEPVIHLGGGEPKGRAPIDAITTASSMMVTGEVRYSNAGHNPPLVLKPGRPPEWLPLPEGFLLGAMEDSPYETRQILLAPGDTLLLYTDGITEAMNGDKLFYEERRLVRVTEEHGQTPPEELVGEVLRSVRAFAGSEPQSDDITMLALSFRGRAENPE